MGRGYYPKMSKIFLIVQPDNLKTGKQFVLCHEFQAFTGAHYLGGLIRDGWSKLYMLKYRASKFVHGAVRRVPGGIVCTGILASEGV